MSNVETSGVGETNTSSPREMASQAAQAVKQEVATFAAQAQEKAFEQADQKKQSAADTLSTFAGAIRRAGDELAEHDQSLAGRVVRQAADGLEGLTRSLSDKRPEELLDAVRDFGRRNPAAFIAGAVLIGVAAGRFLRSSGAAQSERSFAGGADDESGYGSASYRAASAEPDVGGAEAWADATPISDTTPEPSGGLGVGQSYPDTDDLDRPRTGPGY